MCSNVRRPLLWAAALIGVSLLSMATNWDGGSFWGVFFAIVGFGAMDTSRRAKVC